MAENVGEFGYRKLTKLSLDLLFFFLILNAMQNQMELVQNIDNYIDFEVEIAGDEYRSVILLVTYIKDEKRFYGLIVDHGTGAEREIKDLPESTAHFLIGEKGVEAIKLGN